MRSKYLSVLEVQAAHHEGERFKESWKLGSSLRCKGTPSSKLIHDSEKERWLVCKENRRKCEKVGGVLGHEMTPGQDEVLRPG